MSDNAENRISFVDVLAFVARYRIAIIVALVIGLLGTVLLFLLLPPDAIEVVYASETVVTMRSRYQGIPSEINPFMSEPRYRLVRWDRSPEDLGELFIEAGYETDMNAYRLGDMLLEEEAFVITEESGNVIITVTGVDADVATAALVALADEAQRVGTRLLQSQSQDYIERVYGQYNADPGEPLPPGVPSDIQERLLLLEPYAAGRYTNPIRANEPIVREQFQDRRGLAAAALVAAILSLVIVICLIDSYRRSIVKDPKKMEKLRAAWRAGATGKRG